jgi:hypothetical protein
VSDDENDENEIVYCTHASAIISFVSGGASRTRVQLNLIVIILHPGCRGFHKPVAAKTPLQATKGYVFVPSSRCRLLYNTGLSAELESVKPCSLSKCGDRG